MSATDFFYREAQRLGYVARSAFKLLQMQKQYKLIKPGSSVLDLGFAPGSWLQVVCQSLGPLNHGGAVVGIDLKKVKPPYRYCDSRVQTICADVMKLPREQVLALSPLQKGFSVILSDMCPLVSGIKFKDAALSMELGMRAIDLALGEDVADPSQWEEQSDLALGAVVAASPDSRHALQREEHSDCTSGPAHNGVLQEGGNLIIKLLENEDVQEIHQRCKPLFRKTSLLRPKATKSSSREIYLVCQDLLRGR